MLEGLHDLVGEKQLLEACEEKLAGKVEIDRVNVIFYGPKSTGKGWIQLKNEADALLAFNELDTGFLVRRKEVKVDLPKKHTFERHIKQNAKKKKKLQNKTQVENEILRLQNRIGCVIEFDVNDQETFIINIFPDEDFPYELEYLKLKYTVPSNYPNESCEIEVLNPPTEIPETLRASMEKKISDRISRAYKRKPMIVGSSTWIKNQLESLMINQSITFMHQAENLGVRIRKPSEIVVRQTSVSSSEEEYEESSSSGNSSPEEDDQTINYPSSTAHRGTQLKCTSFETPGASLLECYCLKLLVKCSKCNEENRISINASQTNEGECSKCFLIHSVTFRPEILHQDSNILGYVDKENCSVVEALPSLYYLTCDNCLNKTQVKNISYDSVHHVNCETCFAKMEVNIERIEFSRVKKGRNNINYAKNSRRRKKGPGFKRGEPLPRNGACKHYKKSKRYLRFPCCGRAFACDICHDEAEDHPFEWAKKMICGFCAGEQPFNSTKPCQYCKKDMVGAVKTSHWEGGSGCRDPVKMSRKDKRKYKRRR
eukprot:TRINITY_DN879_c0_g2_i1.p1 TRINITY_DN879_c0_g2~~TRINITY_DN879_c0_g2_i1.p1  ORF type:complete len:542 (-),score=120.48 TRINITY_DN879_c0_g2_i1:132-1757(-)